MRRASHDTARVLARLKDFQRRTVEYVFQRFYVDPDPADRFLVADEVGLGKTLVARGVIAKAIDALRDTVKRIDIVYICSNVSIASQNIARLNVSGVQEFVRPTRLALLPMHIAGIRNNKVNYVSLTPGTSFDPKSREGKDEERALIHRMLKGRVRASKSGLRRLLQCRVSDENWRWWTRVWKPETLDEDIRERFTENILNDNDLHERLVSFCNRSKRRVLWGDPERLELVSELRFRLAEMSVDMLEPDLIILDEFQRFKNLLDQENPDARLAQRLFRFPGVKTLLLSATPYKMLSLDHEQEDDHYPDFLSTLRFLFGTDDEVEATKREIAEFRHALYSLAAGDCSAIRESRDHLRSRLGRVMCRTERVGMTNKQDAMLFETSEKPTLRPDDLHQAVLADRVATSVGARDIMEYWKSSPYLINFLRRYEFRHKLEEQCDDPTDDLLDALASNRNRLLRKSSIRSYREVDPANPRMRDLYDHTIEAGLWKVLWMPPSMPYCDPGGPFTEVSRVTKALVFSAWNVVPDAIAALCSYEAERRMLGNMVKDIKHDTLYDDLRPLLRFTRGREGRLTGMPVLIHLYPSPSLASIVDPLLLALDHGGPGPVPSEHLLKQAEDLIAPHVERVMKTSSSGGQEDQRWFWALPAILDGSKYPKMSDWLCDKQDGWVSVGVEDDGDRGGAFEDHLDLFRRAMDNDLDPPLGSPPSTLLRVLAEMSVGAPGVCALRAIRRAAPTLAWDDSHLLRGAVRVSDGFRTLFNLPESIALLRGDDPDTIYWRLGLKHCLQGNIQSLLDEQVHCLTESLGVVDQSEPERAMAIGESIGSALSIRTAQLQIDDVRSDTAKRKIRIQSYNTRCRFALRFAELKDERGSTLARADTVREAFNSPFRPFILASTSIGQEGLDFHTWCHAVVHWNLPANPVDLEQREGRVHRYKGHAIRKNIAAHYGLSALRTAWDRTGDPWHAMFELAKRERPEDASDLVPYWLYEIEGGAHIERRVPMLPFSREEPHLRKLKRMLGLYRLVFGQPRQEDILTYLATRMTETEATEAASQWRVDLSPPAHPHNRKA